jgi:hypothetical protein
MTTSDQPMDHVPPAGDSATEREQSDLERNITTRSTWVRLLFMVVFGILYGVTRLVTFAVVAIQFFHVLFTGETNDQLKTFGRSLAVYSFEVVDYLTFNTETRPFPLDTPWPEDLPVRAEAVSEEDASA